MEQDLTTLMARKQFSINGLRAWSNPQRGWNFRLGKLESDVLATHLSEWLRTHQGQLPSSLALDGKMIRQTIGLVCLVDHETGVPEAMGTMSQKEGEGDRCELKTAQRLIEEMPDLTGKRITADALHCQTKTAQAIVAKGGDFVAHATIVCIHLVGTSS
jgi:hypothetical protein